MESENLRNPELLGDSNLPLQTNMKPKTQIKIRADAEFPLEVESFSMMVCNKEYFVDKTLLIKKIIEYNRKTIMITRPRRWGKTLNLQMLREFFGLYANAKGKRDEERISKNKNAFESTKIWDQQVKSFYDEMNFKKLPDKANEYQGKYPIIFVTFAANSPSSNDEESLENAIKMLSNSIKLAFKDHIYLLEKMQDEILDSVKMHLKEDEVKLINQSITVIQKEITLDDLAGRHKMISECILWEDYKVYKNLIKGTARIEDLKSSLKILQNLTC